MTKYYNDLHTNLYNKSCCSMGELKENSVQCVVTSPPYWGLRKYSGEQDLIWGGDKDCLHQWGGMIPRAGYRSSDTNPGKLQSIATQNRDVGGSNFCSLCNAWRGAYGLEPTPEMYVEHTIVILREIRRVLRKDGVVFWNIGDSFNSAASNQSGNLGNAAALRQIGHRTPLYKGLKPKDLCLIPFRVAIAAQEDGWWVRSDIIWSKPNPMPESVTDRPTNSHEYILMLTKSKDYYWDQEAVMEEYSPTERWGGNKYNGAKKKGLEGEDAGLDRERNCRPNTGRNLRSVWTFPTQPYPEAHFAVFPEKLPELCIKAASKEGDIILDPFAGAGTTLWVAKKLNRNAVGYELSGEYCKLIVERIRQQILWTIREE